MLLFHRNGVRFSIPIAKDAVYDRDLLERQIHRSLIALQALKDRSGDIEQMRYEKPGEFIAMSKFGQDDIIIIPPVITEEKKKPELSIELPRVGIVPAIELFFEEGTFAGIMLFDTMDLSGPYKIVPAGALATMHDFSWEQWTFAHDEQPYPEDAESPLRPVMFRLLIEEGTFRDYTLVPCVAEDTLDITGETTIADSTVYGESYATYHCAPGAENHSNADAGALIRWVTPCIINRHATMSAEMIVKDKEDLDLGYEIPDLIDGERGTVKVILSEGDFGSESCGETPDMGTPPTVAATPGSNFFDKGQMELPNLNDTSDPEQYPSHLVPIWDSTFDFTPTEETQFLPIGYTNTESYSSMEMGYAADFFSGCEGSILVATNLNGEEYVSGFGLFEKRQERNRVTQYTRLDGIDAGVSDYDYVSNWNLPKRLGQDWEYPFYASVFFFTNDWNGSVPSVPAGRLVSDLWRYDESVFVDGQRHNITPPQLDTSDEHDDYYWDDPFPIKPRYWNINGSAYFMVSLVRSLHYYQTQNAETEYYIVDHQNDVLYRSPVFDYSHYIGAGHSGMIGPYDHYYHYVPDVLINNQPVYGRGDFRLFQYLESKTMNVPLGE